MYKPVNLFSFLHFPAPSKTMMSNDINNFPHEPVMHKVTGELFYQYGL